MTTKDLIGAMLGDLINRESAAASGEPLQPPATFALKTVCQAEAQKDIEEADAILAKNEASGANEKADKIFREARARLELTRKRKQKFLAEHESADIYLHRGPHGIYCSIFVEVKLVVFSKHFPADSPTAIEDAEADAFDRLEREGHA